MMNSVFERNLSLLQLMVLLFLRAKICGFNDFWMVELFLMAPCLPQLLMSPF